MKLKIVGSMDCRFVVDFWIKDASGKLVHSNNFNVETLLEAYEIVKTFDDFRRRVRNSSNTLFGGDFPVYSFGWLARHSCLVEIYDAEEDLIIESVFVQHPYLEYIINSVN